MARVIGGKSLELPGGPIETRCVAIPIRTIGRACTQSSFENIVIRSADSGAQVVLRDIATSFNGDPANSVRVYRVGYEPILSSVALAQDH